MSRGRHGRRSLSASEKKQLVEKYERLCAKGKHEWRPTFISECLGSTPEWDNCAVNCEHCGIRSTFNKLKSKQKELVVEIARVNATTYEQVRIIHPMRTFSNSGI